MKFVLSEIQERNLKIETVIKISVTQHTLTSMINNKWITLYLKNPLKTYNKVKEIFKPLTCKIDFGKLQQVGGFPV